MIWQNIHYLWLLAIIPGLVLLVWWNRKRILDVRRKYFEDSLFENINKGYWKLADKIRQAGIYLAIGCFIIALAGPKVGTEVREVKRQGVDMLIALDLSASMNAEDIKPSRLDKAKYEINRLIDRLQGDRIGLIIFTGEAYLQSPLTLDYSALRLFLNIVNTDQLPSATTEIGEAMEVALNAFETSENEQGSNAAKVLLIVSDGENQSTGYKKNLEDLKDKGVRIFSLGIGSSDGSRIPVYDEDNNLLGYKRNKEGQIVTTKLNPELLKTVASSGGGSYFEIQRGSEGIDALLGELDELEKGEFASQEYADFKNQYQWLVAAGMAFLTLYFIIPVYKEDKA